MDMNDAAVEAKEAAVRELANLLPAPENLINLPVFKLEYSQRQQANDSQLSSSVTTQVDQARSGISSLQSAQSTIEELRSNFVLIEKLCHECNQLIEKQDLIMTLNTVRNNLTKTIKDAEGMLSISIQAEDAKKKMADEKELLYTFKHLTILEGKRRFALAAASSRPQEAGRLRTMFENLSQTKEEFEAVVFKNIRDCFRLAKEDPQTLVRSLKVVEMQEEIDYQVDEEQANREDIPLEKWREMNLEKRGSGYFDRTDQHVLLAVQDRFAHLLDICFTGEIKVAIEEASAIVDGLQDIHTYVTPCFPPKYSIFQRIVQFYIAQFVVMFNKLADRTKELSNIDILKLVVWLKTSEDKLIQLGVMENVAKMLLESVTLEPIILEYATRMSSNMKVWLTNIFNMDKTNPPVPTKDGGPLYTGVSIDVFRLLTEQVQQVQENSNSLMLGKCAEAIIQIITDFQEQELEWLKEPPQNIGLESLCALINNNVRCHDLAVDLGNSMAEGMDPDAAEKLDFMEPCQGFLEVAKKAASACIDFMFEDEGLVELYSMLYTKDYLDGLITETFIATVDDYFSDLQKWVEDRSFRRLCESSLDRTVLIFVDYLLINKHPISDEVVEQTRKDEVAIRDYFTGFISEKRVMKKIQPLLDIRSIVESNSKEDFTLSYTQLLQNAPDCPPEVVERIVTLRQDIPRPDAREVIKDCREAYEEFLKVAGPPKTPSMFASLSFIKNLRAAKK